MSVYYVKMSPYLCSVKHLISIKIHTMKKNNPYTGPTEPPVQTLVTDSLGIVHQAHPVPAKISHSDMCNRCSLPLEICVRVKCQRQERHDDTDIYFSITNI